MNFIAQMITVELHKRDRLIFMLQITQALVLLTNAMRGGFVNTSQTEICDLLLLLP